jgi:hypothetical protein
MSRKRTILFILGAGVVLLATSPWWLRSIRQQMEIFRLGKMHFEILNSTDRLPPVDMVEINVLEDALVDPDKNLMGNDDYATKPSPGTFPVRPYRRFDKILSTVKVSGTKAEEIAEHWRSLHFSQGFSGLCHYPAYGLRFFKGGDMIFETSVCWLCSNFSIGPMFWGFDTRYRSASNLLSALQKEAPVPMPQQVEPNSLLN